MSGNKYVTASLIYPNVYSLVQEQLPQLAFQTTEGICLKDKLIEAMISNFIFGTVF
jgi:hypothetical protein